MSTIWCISPFFNPAGYQSRVRNYLLFAEGLARQRARLLTVELAFNDDPFRLPAADMTFRLRGRSIMWQKECLINYAISQLPPDCSRFAWLDCDLLFAEDGWLDSVGELLESYDVVQLFQQVVHLPPGHTRFRGQSLGTDPGIAGQACNTPDWLSLRRQGRLPFAVPGYGWAARRSAFAETGLYDRLICGNGDAFLADCYFDSFGIHHYVRNRTPGMIADMEDWRRGFAAGPELRVGYLPGDIYHLWHGTLENRCYQSRDDILLTHDYDPRTDVRKVLGVYEWSSSKPRLHTALWEYFCARKEDET
jgi:hypothetical protein